MLPSSPDYDTGMTGLPMIAVLIRTDHTMHTMVRLKQSTL